MTRKFFLVFIIFICLPNIFPDNRDTISTLNPPMFSRIMEAQDLRTQGKMTEAIAKYREAITLAKKDTKAEFESYIHCRISIAEIYTYGTVFGKFTPPEPSAREELWDKAIKEYQAIVEEIKGKENWINQEKYPYLYSIKKEAQFNLAVHYRIKGKEQEASQILIPLSQELKPFESVMEKIRKNDPSLKEEMITLGEAGVTTKTRNISPVAINSLSYLSRDVTNERENKITTDMLLHPEKYPITKCNPKEK